MAETEAASGALPPGGPAGGDLEDGNVSSPLTEVDDKDAHDEEMERMHLDDHDHDGVDSSSSGDEVEDLAIRNDGSDSDSALSEAGSDVGSDDNDTEAETLRLFDTPRTLRHRDDLADQFTDDQVFHHTPSKSRMTQAAADDGSVSGDEASSASSRAGADESPIKHATAPGASLEEEEGGGCEREEGEEEREGQGEGEEEDDEADVGGSLQHRKRKRSSLMEPLDPDEAPVQKRASLSGPRKGDEDEDGEGEGDGDGDGDGNSATIDDEPTASSAQRGDPSPPRSTENTPQEDPTATAAGPRVSKKSLRAAAKGKMIATDSADDETPAEAEEESPDATAEETRDPQDEDIEIDPEEEAANKNAEEMEKKQAAYRDWTHIEEMFSIFRERLYTDRLQRLEEEEQSLLAAEPTHPDYLNMKQCLDDRLNQKIEAANKELELSIKAHDRRAVAQRSQIWSQYHQAVRELREQNLEGLGRQWYDVQGARRTAHSFPDYGLLFPKEPIMRIRNAIAYNTEVSTLAGLAKYEGFPAGPELKGASAHELDADLALMARARRGRPRMPTGNNQLREDYQSANLNRLGPAGEQFLKDTPWANPNHSAHKLSYQNPSSQGESSHEAFAAAAAARAAAPRNLSSAPDLKASLLDSSAPPARSASLSARLPESPEIARSMTHSPAHQMQRIANLANLTRGSRAAAAS